MEVSTLRDRRLVALFATVVIIGSGAAAAVVELGGIAHYGGLPFSESALGPEVGEPQLPAEPPPVVVVVREEPPSEPLPGPRPVQPATPAPKPDPCAAGGARGAKADDDCRETATPPTGAATIVKVDTDGARRAPRLGDDVVIASESDEPIDDRGAPKVRHNGKDAEKPRRDDDVADGSGLELPSIELPSVELPIVELPIGASDGTSDLGAVSWDPAKCGGDEVMNHGQYVASQPKGGESRSTAAQSDCGKPLSAIANGGDGGDESGDAPEVEARDADGAPSSSAEHGKSSSAPGRTK